ncbi:amino acid ABC transporter permease [Variovorax sp. VNK109]|uniref:amino acid ABC transporter permease n=1 Tax=Variovorax sp. VNK109 TaxID=3400919 RepID=UPI003C0FB7E2
MAPIESRAMTALGKHLRIGTVAAVMLLAWVAWNLIQWGVVNASWSVTSASQCNPDGACWAVIRARYHLLFFGLYPIEEQWRAALACVAALGAIGLTAWPRLWHMRTVGLLFLCTAGLIYALLRGGVPSVMPYVPTDKWGGFALTIFLYVFGVVLGFPIGVALALLRRHRSRAVSGVTAFVVDTMRTLPMVMVLFTVGVLVPMVAPEWLTGDKLWRVTLAFAFVYGCYQSEIVRAGLQSIPRTQEDAAKALALSPYLRLRLVLLPQGLTNGLPATVNLLVATFKETSIVAIIGFFDFTAASQAAYGNADWTNAYLEVYLVVAMCYFTCASAVGWLGHRVEKNLRQSRG